MVASILDEVHEARRKIFEEAGNDLHVFFQRLREAEKKHPERVMELPRCASIDDPPRIIPYAGSEDTRLQGVSSQNTPGESDEDPPNQPTEGSPARFWPNRKRRLSLK